MLRIAHYDVPNPRPPGYAARMNYWFWLLIILTPIIVFSVKPQAGIWLRAGRLALAVAVGLAYILINLAENLSNALDWEAYNSCRFKHSGHIGPYERSLAEKLDTICPGVLLSKALEVSYLWFGWILAITYVGIFELVWRIRHRRTLRAMGKAFKGRWLSNVLIILSMPVWLYVSFFMLLIITLQALGRD